MKLHRAVAQGLSAAGKVAGEALDGGITIAFPGWGLRRRHARLAYEAAKDDRTIRRRPEVGSADDDLLPDLPKLRSNSRTMVRDDGTGAALLNTYVEQCVGNGIDGKGAVQANDETGFTQAQADTFNEASTRWYEKWMVSGDCDSTAVANGYMMQLQAFVEFVRDGELLYHRLAKKPGGDRRFATCYESIDVDRLQDPLGNREELIRGGIEVDRYGAPVAYHITPRHPTDSMRYRSRDPKAKKNEPVRYARVDGDLPSIVHGFRRLRAGQRRGVPMFASVFGLIEGLNDVLKSEVVATRAASKIVGVITQNPNFLRALPANLQKREDGQWIEKMETGVWKRLQVGEAMTPFVPNRPGNTWQAFVERTLRIICANFGMPYELVARDFARMSFSGARIALQEARRSFAMMQSQFFHAFCQPTWNAVLYENIAMGRIPAPPNWNTNRAAYYDAEWVPPSWGYVDPSVDVQTSSRAVDACVSTPQIEAARAGLDWRRVLEQKSEWLAYARELEERNGHDKGELTREKPERIETLQPVKEPEQDPEPADKKNSGDEPQKGEQEGQGNEGSDTQ